VVLSNKKIIVVGGTSGIGWNAVQKFIEEGAQVISIGKHDNESSNESIEGLTTLYADARKEETIVQAIQICLDTYKGFDGLFHVAGGSGRSFGDGPLHEMSLEGWEKTIELNATSVMLSNKAAIQYFLNHKQAGAIVNLASVLASDPAPTFFSTHAYAAAKSAIIGLSTAAAAHYAKENIRINVISPGLIETPMSKRATENTAIMDYIKTKQPLDGGRIGKANDLSSMTALLLSDHAKFITGQNICIDGGWSVSEGKYF
jgi:NAD(P)-dependent dehydrogenase (short-subunit alcohol dehydrogenase family)